jgi:hypothetical protein
MGCIWDGLKIFWDVWGVWSQLKEGIVDTEAILKIVALLIPMIAPLITAGLKKIVPKLPKLAIVILQPLLGILISLITPVDPETGAVLGMAGIGVREVVDQAKKTITRNFPTQ